MIKCGISFICCLPLSHCSVVKTISDQIRLGLGAPNWHKQVFLAHGVFVYNIIHMCTYFVTPDILMSYTGWFIPGNLSSS